MKSLKFTYYLLAALAPAGSGLAQTKIDLSTQAKAVDFSQADSTRPSKTGTALPAKCAPGETFLKLDAAAGRNLYICTAVDHWILQGADAAAPTAENANAVLSNDGSGTVWKSLAGDVSGPPDTLTVQRIQGRAVSGTAPASGQVLGWNGVSWNPQSLAAPDLSSVFGRTGAITAQAGDYRFDQISGTVLGSQLPALGGDLSGAHGAATVSRLQNRPVAAAAPAAGQVLTWSGAQWEPQAATGGVTSAFGRSGAITAQPGDYSFGQISGFVADGQLPALGGDLAGGATAATVAGLQNRPVAATAPATGQVLTWSGTQWTPQQTASANAADVTRPNSYAAGNRQTFSGNASSAGLRVAPSILPAAAQAGDMVVDAADANQMKVYDGASWVTVIPEPAHANYAIGFNSRTVVTAPGSSHQLGTANLLVGCYDNSSPGKMVEPSAISVDPASYDVTIEFPTAQSGRCVINGFNGATGIGWGGAGAVGSVFGRTGDIAASAGDYDFSQIGGTVPDSQIGAGVNAAKIGAGTVSNAAYGRLANVASDIQAQIDGKADASHAHTAAGDVSGPLDDVKVTGIQGLAVSTAAPANGQVLAWHAGTNKWQPATMSGTGGGAGMAAQLGDFAAAKTGPSELTIGQGCGLASPCNVRFGSRTYSFAGSATATLTAGAGTAYIYVTADGILTVGHTMSVTCSSGCTAVSEVTGFPEDSVPLFSWTAGDGSWEDSGVDRRGFLSRATILGGAGIVVVEAGGQSTIAVDGTIVPGYFTTSISLDFPLIAAGACSADLTFALTGATPGDAVAAGWPEGLESGLIGMMRVNAPDQIAVRLCAMGRDIDPESGIFRATVIRGL